MRGILKIFLKTADFYQDRLLLLAYHAWLFLLTLFSETFIENVEAKSNNMKQWKGQKDCFWKDLDFNLITLKMGHVH